MIESNLCILNDLIGHTGDIECLAWSPSVDFLLASGSQDKTIRVSLQFLIESISLFFVAISYGMSKLVAL